MISKFPSRGIIELHYSCNLKCQTCNIWREEFKIKREVPGKIELKDWLVIQEKLSSSAIKQITYVGGEPFLYTRIFEHIENFHTSGVSTAVVTNGSMLSFLAMEKILISGLDTLIFSLDGPADINDAIRGEAGLFESIVDRIRWIQNEKKTRKIYRPKVYVYFTISKKNFLSISAMMEIAQKLDVNALRFQLVSVVEPEVVDQTNDIFREDVVGFHSYAVDPALKLNTIDLNKVRDILGGFRLWSKTVGIKVMVENCLQKNSLKKGCQFIDRSFVLSPTGDVYPCPMLTRYSIGNLHSSDLETIWINEKLQKLRNIIRNDRYLPVCSQCCVEKIFTK